MPRTRDIRPDFNDSDDIAALSLPCRTFYICSWGHMDSQGLIEDSPRALRSKIFPRDEIPIAEIEKWRDELLARGPSGRPRLIRFQWKGRTLLYCPGLCEHNSIYDDEPARFEVPDDVLKKLCEELGIERVIKPPKSAKKGRKDAGGVPAVKPPATGQNPAGSREGAGQNPAGSRAFSSSSASAPTSASPSPSPSPSAPAGGATPAAGKLRVVDNSPPAGENGDKSQESCALCLGTGKLIARIRAVENAPPTPYRCECELGERMGMKTWPRWSSNHPELYEIVEPRAG